MSDDDHDPRDSVWLDVLLFVLVLIGVLVHKRRTAQDDDE